MIQDPNAHTVNDPNGGGYEVIVERTEYKEVIVKRAEYKLIEIAGVVKLW